MVGRFWAQKLILRFSKNTRVRRFPVPIFGRPGGGKIRPTIAFYENQKFSNFFENCAIFKKHNGAEIRGAKLLSSRRRLNSSHPCVL